MLCPSCGFENIDGADLCGRCLADMTTVGLAENGSDIEGDLLRRPLGDLATGSFLRISPDQSVRETVAAWKQGGQHCAVVVSDESIVGIFTERDLLCKVASDYAARADAPVRDFMTPDPVTLDSEVPIAFGLNRMMVGGYRHVPISRDGRLCGVVSVRDILAYLVHQFSDVIPANAS